MMPDSATLLWRGLFINTHLMYVMITLVYLNMPSRGT